MADAGAACPLFYPIDSRALEGLEYVPPYPLPPGVPGLRPPSVTSPPCPLGAWPTSQGDTLRLSILVTGGPKTVNFYGRTQAQSGGYVPFSRTVTGNSPTTAATADLPMPAGCLLNLDAIAVGGLGAATVYVLGELGHIEGGTFSPYAQVLSGLLTGYGVANSVASAGGGGAGGGACCIGTLGWVFPDPLTGDYAYTYTSTPASGKAERIRYLYYNGVPGTGAGGQRFFHRIYLTAGGDVGRWLSPVIANGVTTWAFRGQIGGETADAALQEYVFLLPDPGWMPEEWTIDFGWQSGNTDAANDSSYLVIETVDI